MKIARRLPVVEKTNPDGPMNVDYFGEGNETKTWKNLTEAIAATLNRFDDNIQGAIGNLPIPKGINKRSVEDQISKINS